MYSADEDLPRYGHRLVGPRLGIDDADLVAGAGIAVGLHALLLGRVEEGEGHPDPDLAHPESGHEVAEGLAGAPGDRDRARHAGAADAGAHARHVAGPSILGVQQLLVVRVEAVDDRGPLARDEIEGLAPVEGLGQHLTGPPDHGHERPLDEAEGVEERQVHEDHVAHGQTHAIAVIPRVPDHAVAVDRPLREPGRSRGVEDERAVLRIHAGRALAQRVGAHRRAADPGSRASRSRRHRRRPRRRAPPPGGGRGSADPGALRGPARPRASWRDSRPAPSDRRGAPRPRPTGRGRRPCPRCGSACSPGRAPRRS